MKAVKTRVFLATAVLLAFDPAIAEKDPPPYESHIEVIAPVNEVAVITSLGGEQPQALRFVALDDEIFESTADELIVKPGCRCTCVVVDRPPAAAPAVITVPMCVDAQPGHTYIVSFSWGWNGKLWVNDWPTSDVSGKLFHWKFNYKEPRLFMKNTLFKYKYRPDGEFVATRKVPAPAFCADPGTICEPPMQ